MKSLGVLGFVLCSTLASGLAMETFVDEAGLLQEKVKAAAPWVPGSQGKAVVYWAALYFDVIWITLKMILSFTHYQLGPLCELMALVYWYVMTVLVIGWSFQSGDKISIPDGFDMASQQMTSIGYGSTTAETPEQRVFHALNGVASQLGPASAFNDLLPAGDDPMKKALLLILAGVANWILFNADGFDGIDPLYATMITATTIGYGDLAPKSSWSKIVSALVTPALTYAFNNFFNANDPDKDVSYRTLTWCGGSDQLLEEGSVKTEVEKFTEEMEKEAAKVPKGKSYSIGEEILRRMFQKSKFNNTLAEQNKNGAGERLKTQVEGLRAENEKISNQVRTRVSNNLKTVVDQVSDNKNDDDKDVLQQVQGGLQQENGK